MLVADDCTGVPRGHVGVRGYTQGGLHVVRERCCLLHDHLLLALFVADGASLGFAAALCVRFELELRLVLKARA